MKIIDNIKYFTRSETAKMIGVPVKTLEHWAHKKTGPAYYKPGKAVLYAEPDIIKFKASKRIGAAS